MIDKITKECNVCFKVLPLDKAHFQVRKSYFDGFDCSCKKCRVNKHREYMKNYRLNGPAKKHKVKSIVVCSQYDNYIYC